MNIMRKAVIVLMLIGTLIFSGTAGLARGNDKISTIATELLDLYKDVQVTSKKFANNEIAYATIASDFKNHYARSKIIYKKSVKQTNHQNLILLTANTRLIMKLYYEGFRDGNIEKIKLATSFLSKVLVPEVEGMNYD